MVVPTVIANYPLDVKNQFLRYNQFRARQLSKRNRNAQASFHSIGNPVLVHSIMGARRMVRRANPYRQGPSSVIAISTVRLGSGCLGFIRGCQPLLLDRVCRGYLSKATIRCD